MKKIIISLCLVLTLCLTGCINKESKIETLTGIQVQEVLNTIEFETAESSALVTIIADGVKQLEMDYSISASNEFFKTIKKQGNKEEINHLYKNNNKYYLSQTLEETTKIELTSMKAKELLGKVISDQNSYYDNIKVDVENISDASKEVDGKVTTLKYVEVINGYFYEVVVVINGTELVSLVKEFSINSVEYKTTFVVKDLVVSGGN